MTQSSTTGHMDAASPERLRGAGQLVRFGHNYQVIHRRHAVEGPVLVEASADAEVVDGLEVPTLKVDAEGAIDPRHQRIKAAEDAVAAALAESQPADSEELLGLAA